MSSATVLVVEDDPDIQRLVRLLLERAGYAVRGASDGHEALRVLFSQRPDLVLLDIGLPGLDGWQVLERVRELSDVPVVMLTAQGDELDKVRGLRAGVDDFSTSMRSSTRACRRSAPRAIAAADSCCSVLSGPLAGSSSSSLKPRMSVSGVRSSCAATVRKRSCMRARASAPRPPRVRGRARVQLELDPGDEILQPAQPRWVGWVRLGVEHAQPPERVTVGGADDDPAVEAQPVLGGDERVGGEAYVRRRVGHHERRAVDQLVRAERVRARDLAADRPEARLRPVAVGVDQRDQGHRHAAEPARRRA